MITKVLSGHYSPETAYMVDDYPYGFRLRCKIRYWLEVNDKGTRFWSQTTNPKRGDVWNKPKSSTYCVIGAMFLDEQGHVSWNGLSLYEWDKVRDFLATYGEGLTPAQVAQCKNMADLFDRREAAKKDAVKYDTDAQERLDAGLAKAAEKFKG